jgi:hypothetical protein
LKEVELMALLEEIITKIREEVMGRIVFPRVDHPTKIGKELWGEFYFQK